MDIKTLFQSFSENVSKERLRFSRRVLVCLQPTSWLLLCPLLPRNYDASVLIVTDKGLLIGATATGLSIMMFIQMPMLLIMYMCNGGYKAHPDLPYNYTRLLFTAPCLPTLTSRLTAFLTCGSIDVSNERSLFCMAAMPC